MKQGVYQNSRNIPPTVALITTSTVWSLKPPATTAPAKAVATEVMAATAMEVAAVTAASAAETAPGVTATRNNHGGSGNGGGYGGNGRRTGILWREPLIQTRKGQKGVMYLYRSTRYKTL